MFASCKKARFIGTFTFVKAVLSLFALFLLLLAPFRAAGQTRTANASFYNRSVAIFPATTGSGASRIEAAYTYRFDGTLNDELASGGHAYLGAYSAFLFLLFPNQTDPLSGEALYFFPSAVLGVPTETDSDINGVPDFFDVPVAVSGAITSGEAYVDDGSEVTTGRLSATWTRAAGSSTGTVRINVRFPDYGINATFNHTFEISSYTGTFTYRRDGDTANGTLDVSRAGGSGRITGIIPLVRTNRAELGFESAALTNQSGEAFRFESTELLLESVQRLEFPTNGYYAHIQFPESSPRAPGFAEYIDWELVIRDTNDTDHDGIPDLTDDASVAPPGPPSLRISLAGGQPALTLVGDVGARYIVETSTTPNGFGTLVEITLSGPEATITLPSSPGDVRFFRARIP